MDFKQFLADLFGERRLSRISIFYRASETAMVLSGLIAMAVSTESDLDPLIHNFCLLITRLILAAFAMDWFLRLWTAPRLMPQPHPWACRWAWMTSRNGLMGLLCWLPMLVATVGTNGGPDATLLAALWLLRFAHYSRGVDMLLDVFQRERQAIIGVLLIFGMVLAAGSVLGYLFEREAQPQNFGNLTLTLYWTITTISTAGYGDFVPMTGPGRILAGILMFSGIIVFGLLAGVLATGFADEMKRRDFLRNWDLVAKVPMFKGIAPGTISELASKLRPRELPSRSMVVRRGQEGDCMFFIVEGEVEVHLEPAGVRMGQGEFFGELALITGAPRSANVMTTRETQLLVLDIADFRAVAAQNKELMQHIQAEANRRLNNQIESA